MRPFLLLLLSLPACAAAQYKSYCNTRFAFCVRYPEGFHKQREAENGDGTRFSAPDQKASIYAWGALALDDFGSIAEYFTLCTSDIRVTYKLLRDDGFIFSGTDREGYIVYQKTVRRAVDYMGDAATPVFQHLRIRYLPAQQSRYEPYCAVIAASLK